MSFLSARGSSTNHSNNAQLAAVALASGAVVASTILGYQGLRRAERVHRLKKSIPSLEGEGLPRKPANHNPSPSKSDQEDLRAQRLAQRALAGDYDDELIAEQLARNQVFLGADGLSKLRNSFVIVVGCGGVGSHATAALARSGVSRLRLIDFDQVTLSSLNRHAVATLSDVGLAKVLCLQRRLMAIAPWVAFDLRQERFCEEVAETVLSPWENQKPDFVIDAIDNIDTKVALLKYCHDHGLPVISSMGAGCKSDPTRIVVGDISTSTDDRLSRATRRKLKLLGVLKGITTVYSTEGGGEGKAELLPLPDKEFEKGAVGDLSALPNFRVRILPVLGTMPAVFGYAVANHVITSISGYPTGYGNIPGRGREKLYDAVLAGLQGSEEKLVRHFHPDGSDITVGLKLPTTIGDIAFLVEEIYKGRSALTGIPTRLHLVRWRKPDSSPLIRIEAQKSSNVRRGELVCMTKEEAKRHEREVLVGDKGVEDLYDEDIRGRIEESLRDAAGYEGYK